MYCAMLLYCRCIASHVLTAQNDGMSHSESISLRLPSESPHSTFLVQLYEGITIVNHSLLFRNSGVDVFIYHFLAVHEPLVYQLIVFPLWKTCAAAQYIAYFL